MDKLASLAMKAIATQKFDAEMYDRTTNRGLRDEVDTTLGMRQSLNGA